MAEINRDVVEMTGWNESPNPLGDVLSFLKKNPPTKSKPFFIEPETIAFKVAFEQRSFLADLVERTSSETIKQQHEKIENECAEILKRGENPQDYFIGIYLNGEMKLQKNTE